MDGADRININFIQLHKKFNKIQLNLSEVAIEAMHAKKELVIYLHTTLYPIKKMDTSNRKCKLCNISRTNIISSQLTFTI